MICMLLGQLYAADICAVDSKQNVFSRLKSVVISTSSYLPSVSQAAAVAAGCTALYFTNMNSVVDSYTYSMVPFHNGTNTQAVMPYHEGIVGSSLTGQLACFAMATMSQIITKSTVVQLLSALSCFATGAKAQTFPHEPSKQTPFHISAPKVASNGLPVGNCTYYYEYLLNNPVAHGILGSTPCYATSLSIGGSNFGPTGAVALAPALQQLTRLNFLNISHNAIGPLGMVSLSSALQYLVNLNYLEANYNNIGDAGISALVPALQKLTKLATLRLRSNGFGANGAKTLATVLPQLVSLSEFAVTGNIIGNAGVASLAPSFANLTNLESLNLGGCGIGNSGTNALTITLRHLQKLHWLGLDFNAIGARGASSLSIALKSLRNLQDLYIQNNLLQDTGAADLALALEQSTSLLNVDLSNNNISTSGCSSFESIIHEGSPGADVQCGAVKYTETRTIVTADACCVQAGYPQGSCGCSGDVVECWQDLMGPVRHCVQVEACEAC